MKWEDVLTLLRVTEQARNYPQLKALHDTALATLAAADPNSMTFLSQGDALPAVEDDE